MMKGHSMLLVVAVRTCSLSLMTAWGVTGFEFWVAGYSLVCECLLYYFNKIHFCIKLKN